MVHLFENYDQTDKQTDINVKLIKLLFLRLWLKIMKKHC